MRDEQKEAIRVAGAEALIETSIPSARRRESPRRRAVPRIGVGEIAEDREMDVRVEVAQRQHLDVLQQRRHRAVLVSIVGTTTIVRASSGIRSEKSSRGRRRGGTAQATTRCASAMAMSAAGISRSSTSAARTRGRGALVPERSTPPASSSAVRSQSGPDRGASRARTPVACIAAREPRPVGDIGFEIATPPIDQVIADVGGRSADRAAGGRLACAFDRLQGDPHLRVAARRGELLDRLALPISAEEVHPPVGAGGIALQHLLDQAHRLDILAPVERGAEAQARDRIGDRHLVGGLPLVLAANRRFRGRLLRREMRLDRRADRRQPEAILTNPMQQLDDRGDIERRRQRLATCRRLRVRSATTYSSAARRPRRDASVSAARRLRFSISASFSMLGHAQSSPIVSGATR